MKEYGLPFVIWYNSLWVLSFASIYTFLTLEIIEYKVIIAKIISFIEAYLEPLESRLYGVTDVTVGRAESDSGSKSESDFKSESEVSESKHCHTTNIQTVTATETMSKSSSLKSNILSLDPTLGKSALALMINPVFEPLRILTAALTIKPIVKMGRRMIGRG